MYKAESFPEDYEMSIFCAIQQAERTQNEKLLRFLVNPDVLGILSIAGRKSLTVSDMARKLGLPLATCYKLVEQMVDFGLMARVGITRTSSRGRAANYISSIKSVNLRMTEMRLEAVISWKNGTTQSIYRALDGMTIEKCEAIGASIYSHPSFGTTAFLDK